MKKSFNQKEMEYMFNNKTNLQQVISERIKEFNENVRTGKEKDPYMETLKKYPLMTKFAFWYIDKFLTKK